MSSRVPGGADRPRFLADAMVADLARWLRILGEDCLWAPPQWQDNEVLKVARNDRRVLISRDEQLLQRAGHEGVTGVFVPQQETAGSLGVVYGRLGLEPDEAALATRCSMCNGPLEQVDGQEAARRAESAGKQPPRAEVLERHRDFWSCMVCHQAYWRGTHWDQIERVRVQVLQRLERS